MECPHCTDPCPVDFGYCHCGCGEQTPKTTSHHYPEGSHWKYIRGHHNIGRQTHNTARRKDLEKLIEERTCAYCEDCPVTYGKCHCGCGQDTPLVQHDKVNQGRIAGMPVKVITGHNKGRMFKPEQVRQMRYRYATTGITHRELAKLFDVSERFMGSILRFESYKEAGIDTSYRELEA